MTSQSECCCADQQRTSALVQHSCCCTCNLRLQLTRMSSTRALQQFQPAALPASVFVASTAVTITYLLLSLGSTLAQRNTEPSCCVHSPAAAWPCRKVVIKNPPMHAIPQGPPREPFNKPRFNITKGVAPPKPAKVKIMPVKEPKIIDNTVPFKNDEKIQKPEFRKVFASPSPKPAKVKIVHVKEPKIVDNSQPFKNKEEFPKPTFRKVNAPPSPKPVKVKEPKIVEEPIKDVTSAPFKVGCCLCV